MKKSKSILLVRRFQGGKCKENPLTNTLVCTCWITCIAHAYTSKVT